MLVGTDDGPIDVMDFPIEVTVRIRILLDAGKSRVRAAGLAPALKAAVDRGPRAVALGQVPPWRTGAQNPQDAVQDAAMVCRRSSCMGSLRRQQRLESCPLFIREFMSVSHAFTVSTLSSLHTHPRPILGTPQRETTLSKGTKPMKRTFALILAALAAAVLFAGLVYVVLVVARVSEPAATTVHGLTLRRL